jgi:hypothetical protein
MQTTAHLDTPVDDLIALAMMTVRAQQARINELEAEVHRLRSQGQTANGMISAYQNYMRGTMQQAAFPPINSAMMQNATAAVQMEADQQAMQAKINAAAIPAGY